MLFLSSKPPRFSASWPIVLDQVGWLIEGPLLLSTESRRRGAPSTILRQAAMVRGHGLAVLLSPLRFVCLVVCSDDFGCRLDDLFMLPHLFCYFGSMWCYEGE
jgi:hypothetical protein